MVKRATIHVSSRTKKESSENIEESGEQKENNKYNLYKILQPSYLCRRSRLQYCPREAFHFMALFLAMA